MITRFASLNAESRFHIAPIRMLAGGHPFVNDLSGVTAFIFRGHLRCQLIRSDSVAQLRSGSAASDTKGKGAEGYMR